MPFRKLCDVIIIEGDRIAARPRRGVAVELGASYAASWNACAGARDSVAVLELRPKQTKQRRKAS